MKLIALVVMYVEKVQMKMNSLTVHDTFDVFQLYL